jgi:mannose-6-phosphate isomerase class I
MNINTEAQTGKKDKPLRKTEQYLMPSRLTDSIPEQEAYNIYPVSHLGDNKIFNGYDAFTDWIISQKTIRIDGYVGVFWEEIKSGIADALAQKGVSVSFTATADFMKDSVTLDALLKPYLGTDTSVWGTRCTLELEDLYHAEQLAAVRPDQHSSVNILLGTGAALADWEGGLAYIDLPKNELQFRMRAGTINNLGSTTAAANAQLYKRFYFVDWVLLNKHKKAILNQVDVMADGQWPTTLNWMYQHDLVAGLNHISTSVIRVRPWFEPGAWGGQWIKQHIGDLNKDVPNYAWSFELIVPENGLVFESSGYLLEVSFDTLMFLKGEQVLGKHAKQFGDEFPIRFDFLDTVAGGNLSIQCHPALNYIQEHFGETITQDETYYILDCEEDASVYLGFQEDIDPVAFKQVLEESQAQGKEVEITKYVQSHPAKKHDLFLIPNGTVHSAAKGNLVLEISATPYIFTFKMYDWLRLDLDGQPRPINIDHAFNNLDFTRKGKAVQEQLISQQQVIAKGADWQLVHLPTHAEHFYDVHRIEFDSTMEVETDNVCHVLMLVEGEAIRIETADGTVHRYAYAETFVVPAAAGVYRLTNLGPQRAKVIKAFLK